MIDGLHMVPFSGSQDDPSGQLMAERAHRAGAVEAMERLPLVDVSLSFTFHGSHEQATRLIVDVAEGLALDEQVRSAVTYTIGEPR